MKTIYKYVMPAGGLYKQKLPQGFKPLSVGLDPQGILSMWAEVDTNQPPVDVGFLGIGTGWALDNEKMSIDLKQWDYLGTVYDGMMYMWHYYYKLLSEDEINKDKGNQYGDNWRKIKSIGQSSWFDRLAVGA